MLLMKRKGKRSVFITLAILVLVLGNTIIFAQNEINIILNDKKINFPDAKPYMDAQAGRVFVPVRFVAEGLGALVEWDPIDRRVDIIKDGFDIRLKPDEKRLILNGIERPIDTAPFIKDDRIYVPLRVVSECLDMDVEWDEETCAVSLKSKSSKEFVIRGIRLGQSEQELVSNLGEPDRRDISEYGFDWYIYNKDYSKYIQVGVKDGTVVGIYTNADNWESARGIKVGMARANVERLLGKPLQGIAKESGIYLISKQDEEGVYLIDCSYVTIFYDIHNKSTVTALQIIDENIECGLDDYYGDYSEKLRDSFERQVFDLAISIRVRNNLRPFVWSNKAQASSGKHSQDMADNDFFAHSNLKGESPFDRMRKEGIIYTSAAEKIAAGTANAIQAHEGWMNSAGHRANILDDYKNLGVGVAYNSNSRYKYYYTQNFYTGR